MTGEQLKERMAGDWDKMAKEVARLDIEIRDLWKRICDQDEALVESAYAVSDAFRTAFNSRQGNE